MNTLDIHFDLCCSFKLGILYSLQPELLEKVGNVSTNKRWQLISVYYHTAYYKTSNVRFLVHLRLMHHILRLTSNFNYLFLLLEEEHLHEIKVEVDLQQSS